MFEFDLVTLLITAITIIAFAIPFIRYSRKHKNQASEKLTKLKNFLQSNQLDLKVNETWRDRYFLGIDSARKKLIYVQNLVDFEPQIINLEEVLHVSKHEVFRLVGTEKNQRKVLDELHLHLIGKNNKIKASLEVYNGEVFSDVSGEPVLIQKLESLLKEHLQTTDKVILDESTPAK